MAATPVLLALRRGPNAGGHWKSTAWDSDEAYFDIPETPTPDAPDAGTLRLFARNDGTGLGLIDSAGQEFRLMITGSSSDTLVDLVQLMKRNNVLLNAINTQLGKMGQEPTLPSEVEDEEVS